MFLRRKVKLRFDSLLSSSGSAKSHATLPPELPSSKGSGEGGETEKTGGNVLLLPPQISANLLGADLVCGDGRAAGGSGLGSRRGSSFLLGRASVVGTGLSKSDPSFDVYEDKRSFFDFSTSLSVTSASSNRSSGRKRKQSSWKKKLGEPGVILQAQIIRDKAALVSLLAGGHLRELTERLSSSSSGKSEEESEAEFADAVVRCKEEIGDILDHVQMALRDRVSSKKMAQLRQLRAGAGAEHNPALDISVRYFGLDWAEIKDRLEK